MISRTFPIVPLLQLLTPWDRAVSVEPGPVSPDLLDRLRQSGYDQAPVMVSGQPTGMVPTTRLSELFAASMPLILDEPAIVRDRLLPDATLDQVLDIIAAHRSAIVSDGADGIPAGFITLSDLNKHSLRSVLYPLFAELEAELAAAIEACHVEPWTWLGFLDKDKQARLVGYWELSKRDGVDIGPLAGTMLSELLRIVEKTDPLRETLGFESKRKWCDCVGGLIELRNGVMHPVRPLFATNEDVSDVGQQLTRVLDLLGRLERFAQSSGKEL